MVEPSSASSSSADWDPEMMRRDDDTTTTTTTTTGPNVDNDDDDVELGATTTDDPPPTAPVVRRRSARYEMLGAPTLLVRCLDPSAYRLLDHRPAGDHRRPFSSSSSNDNDDIGRRRRSRCEASDAEEDYPRRGRRRQRPTTTTTTEGSSVVVRDFVDDFRRASADKVRRRSRDRSGDDDATDGFRPCRSDCVHRLERSSHGGADDDDDDSPVGGTRLHFRLARGARTGSRDDERDSYRRREVGEGTTTTTKTKTTTTDGGDESETRPEPRTHHRSNKGKTTGFNIFRSEYMRANAIAADADGATRKAHLITCSKLAGARWRGMSETDKRTYKRRAKAHIIVDDNAKKAAVVVDNLPSSRRTTGFHVFRSEYFQRWKRDNPNVSAADRKLSMIISCKEAGAHWKDLSEAEKSTYSERAAMENRCGIPRDDIDIRNFTSSSEELHRGGQANANPYVKIRGMDRSGIPKVLDAYFDSSKERLESSADYFSPFREQDVGYCFQAGEGIREAASEEEVGADQVRVIDSASKANISSESIPEGVDGPMGYGNCLLAIHCQCQHCNSRSPASFIFHPAGDSLSSLAMSKVSFPRSSPCRDGQQRQEVDIGGRILQISRCGAKRTMESSNGFCIVVRTFQYCSVIYAKSTMTTLVVEEECPIEYHMREETRIDLRTTPCRSLTPSYVPVYLSCDPKATDSFFTFPTFAILSRDSAGSSTTIHRVVLRREPVVKGHSLSSSLSDISLIEFCSDSGMAVWAAARSRVMPKLSLGFFKGRSGTVTGYGHSLFRIDLRDDSSSLVWSPSHAEFLTEGIHSINGIMSDATMEHVVWVSSSSACKVWALDVRHKLAKVVVSWSLPLLSDDFGSQSSLTGIYGGGVIMSQPVSSCSSSDNKRVCSIQDIQPPAMFGLKKDLNSNSLCMFQFPCAMPRFGTQPLESAGFQYIPRTNYDVSSIARSSIFPLPDAAGTIFNVGLTSFHYSSRTCLSPKQLDQLCYQTTPGSVIYVITMTSIGDLYCHSLLETNGAEETLARQFIGLPVGTKAIPVPGDVEAKTPNRGCLSVSLTNEFPIPSNAITPFIVREAPDCCQYKSYDIGDILSQKLQTEKSPLAAHDSVDSNTATKEAAFDCYSSNDKVNSYRLAHHGLHESEEKSNSSVSIRYSLSHFPPKFGVVVSSELPEQSSQVGDHLAAATGCHPQPISLPFSQTVVIISNKDQGAMEYDSGDDLDRVINASDKRKSNEIDLGLIRALKSGYYLNEKADTDQQIGVKCEWSSDSE